MLCIFRLELLFFFFYSRLSARLIIGSKGATAFQSNDSEDIAFSDSGDDLI